VDLVDAETGSSGGGPPGPFYRYRVVYNLESQEGMLMHSYQIRLRETRMATDETDDIALFDVTCEGDGRTWRVPVFLSPLFRVLQMGSQAPVESRRETVAGLGARAIAERLKQGLEPPFEEFLVFAAGYPGAPGDPNPLLPYDYVIVCDGEVKAIGIPGTSNGKVMGS